MKSRMNPVLYVLAFLVIASVAAVPGTGTASTIMAVGDSITAGTGSSSGYGYLPYLADILGTGYSFVGPNPFLPNTYANAGYPGYTTEDFLNVGNYANVDGPAGQSYELMGQLAYTYQPDIILLHIGTNDILQNLGGIADRVGYMLNWIKGIDQATKVYLAEIIPYFGSTDPAGAGRSTTDINHAIASFNDSLTNIIPFGLDVQIVDLYSIFFLDGSPNSAYFSTDGIHPNDSGYNAMAQAYGAAMNPVPIPAPVFLLAGGLAGLVAVRRRANRPS